MTRVGETVRRRAAQQRGHLGAARAPRARRLRRRAALPRRRRPGREILSFLAGRGGDRAARDWALTDEALVSVAELLRRYHDAVASFDPVGHAWPDFVPAAFRDGLVSHNDPNLDNVIFSGGARSG